MIEPGWCIPILPGAFPRTASETRFRVSIRPWEVLCHLDRLLQQPLHVLPKLECAISAVSCTQQKRNGCIQDQTECFRRSNTRVCPESGQKGGYHHAGTHPVDRVVAPVREVTHNVFTVSANYLRRSLVPSTHKRHQPMVPRGGHEIKGVSSLGVSVTRRARGGRQPQPPPRRESRVLAGENYCVLREDSHCGCRRQLSRRTCLRDGRATPTFRHR
jgi:hypothetical protein